jgi:hypothetical protein
MTDSVLNGVAVTIRKHASTWHLFLLLIAFASLVPFVIAPLASHVIPKDSSALYAYMVIGFLGANFHVAATGWFYTDREMRSYFRTKPLRYVVIPCSLISGMAAAFYFLDRSVIDYLSIAFLSWQMWHYQKQNVGLLSFVAAGSDGIPLSVWERRTLDLAALAGILGFFSVQKVEPASLATFFVSLHHLGLAIYCLVPITFLIALAQNRAIRTNKLRMLFLGLGGLFFFPTFVFSDSMSALAGYGIAHGLQYVVFMGFVSSNKGTFSPVKLMIIALVGGTLLNLSSDAADWPGFQFGLALYGAFLGAVMTHFVFDADIWRLRQPFQRKYMREKFYFVFDR